jgi:hypothetical protein
MSTDYLRFEAQRIARRAEVQAVERAIRSGRTPAIGDIVEYTIEDDPLGSRIALFRPKSKNVPPKLNRYQFTVDCEHLEEAARQIRPK